MNNENHIVLTDEATKLIIAEAINQCPNHGGARSDNDLMAPEYKELDATSVSSKLNGKPDRWTGELSCDTCFITALLAGTGYEGQCRALGPEKRELCRRCKATSIPSRHQYCPTCRKAVRREKDLQLAEKAQAAIEQVVA